MFRTTAVLQSLMVQSSSPLAPLGVNAAIQAAADPKVVPRPKIFEEFSLKDRVGIVSGGNRGLGLEMALALCELGARAIYCFDLPLEPSKEWKSTEYFVKKLGGRLEYVSGDVRDQKGMWDKVKVIGDKEGRMDVCIAAAGIVPKVMKEAVEFPEGSYQEGIEVSQVIDTNVNGSLYTAQAAGQQMLRFDNPGSIIFISSIAGHSSLKEDDIVAYGASKSAVLQMARSMACELGSKGIRVNSISPGYIRSPMTAEFLKQPETLKRWSDSAPLGRIGRPDELRGVVAWLASDASSFCTGSKLCEPGSVVRQSPSVQLISPLSPIGISAAIQAANDPTTVPRPKIFEKFSLKDRVGIVTGGNGSLGLEMTFALWRTDRTTYCIDLSSQPSKEWKSTWYFRRMDVCVAAAGVLNKKTVSISLTLLTFSLNEYYSPLSMDALDAFPLIPLDGRAPLFWFDALQHVK
ncbi:hypothetical protein C0995_015036 [Termitomyces sp. Mi166|nr:hypothetical protein C0995_015036 [Termitomyces sp. Mi166\